MKSPYDKSTVNANYKIEPWLQRQIGVLVAEHLEAERVVSDGGLLRGFGFEAPDKPVESPEHGAPVPRIGQI